MPSRQCPTDPVQTPAQFRETKIRYQVHYRTGKRSWQLDVRKGIMTAEMETRRESKAIREKPPWLTRRALTAKVWEQMKPMLERLSLATICEEADCPNIGECFRQNTATFLILGRTCTRSCRFCAVEHGQPQPVDAEEPRHLIDAVRQLGLRHVVITSVTRDDLPDGGAAHFAACIRAVHTDTSATVEVLIPDFQGQEAALRTVLEAHPEVLGHNVEVVPRLYPKIRSRANYKRSLDLLQRAKDLCPSAYTKSGLMVGVGEQEQEVIDVMRDLCEVGGDFLTIGQYLRPSAQHHPVIDYVAPATFDYYAQVAQDMGFRGVLCGPFVRSSYRASALLGSV
jgi:lipoic acid synthetase